MRVFRSACYPDSCLRPFREAVQEPPRPFDAWLGDLIARSAITRIRENLLNDTLTGLQPLPASSSATALRPS
jgi:hypothetical protein